METKEHIQVALVQCPMFNVRMPQLGPAYLKSSLEGKGRRVKQFDFNIALYNKVNDADKKYWNYELQEKWVSSNNLSPLIDTKTIMPVPFFTDTILEGWANEVLESKADLIGFTVYLTSLKTSILLAKKIKEIDNTKKIIFGGPAILYYIDIVHDDIVGIDPLTHKILDIIDMIAVGEGEETILEVVERLENRDTLKGCQGIVAKEDGNLVINGLRPLIKELDMLDLPDFAILDKHNFTDKGFLPISASRGCPNRCAFCDYPYLDRYKLRLRSVVNVIKEMKCQIKRYNIKFFHFNDPTINASLKFLSELCESIIKEDLFIRWGASMSINGNMGRDLFSKLKQSGCEYLSFGIESASAKVLRDMKKNFSIDDIQKNLEDCYYAKITATTNWIIGFPTETDEDFKRTLSFIDENRRYISVVDAALFTPKPHTYIYENTEKYGIQLNDGYNWFTKNGLNTYEARLQRLKAFGLIQDNKFAYERIGGFLSEEILPSFIKELKQGRIRIKENEKQAATIKRGPLELFFDQGKGRIFYEGNELTKGSGLYTAILSSGSWTDSPQAIWQIKKLDSKILATGEYASFPMRQIWELELIDYFTVAVNMKMIIEEPVEIGFQDLCITLSDKYQQWKTGNNEGQMPLDFGKTWKEIINFKEGRIPTIQYNDSNTRNNFPPVAIKPFDALSKEHYIMIHDTDDILRSRVLICRRNPLKNNLKFVAGEYPYFSGQIEINKPPAIFKKWARRKNGNFFSSMSFFWNR